MSKQDDKRRRARYTLEFKLDAARLVKGGQDMAHIPHMLRRNNSQLPAAAR